MAHAEALILYKYDACIQKKWDKQGEREREWKRKKWRNLLSISCMFNRDAMFPRPRNKHQWTRLSVHHQPNNFKSNKV